jgi:hypothetical protein
MGGSRSRMLDYSGVLGWRGPKVEMRWGALGAEQGAWIRAGGELEMGRLGSEQGASWRWGGSGAEQRAARACTTCGRRVRARKQL